MQLAANNYIVRVKEIDAGKGDLRPNMLLVMDPRGEEITLSGETTTEPTFGLPATWIEETGREEALRAERADALHEARGFLHRSFYDRCQTKVR